MNTPKTQHLIDKSNQYIKQSIHNLREILKFCEEQDKNKSQTHNTKHADQKITTAQLRSLGIGQPPKTK
ncbi:hypothetical protein [Candidatus Absconditicoccus praedator]|uniref:hypothetical protein n=1 Tax=Candidatus Absconditicoccus praedator TaxID=2735562 RepID=UPI001E5995C9|nr:hypothetical protein [Candidatus Absconditicoccus praedator]UFX82627.1 hypothetical protein HLG78_00545 [Candidatus Absconditicoccus praedator]